MFELFDLKCSDVSLKGYLNKTEKPKATVVLIHGIGEYAGRYRRLSEKLSEYDIALVSMDLRGHGLSNGVRGDCAPRNSVLHDIDCLIEYAENLYPGVPMVMYGHSMGGNIALDYRARGEKNGVPKAYIISAPWIRLTRKIPYPLYISMRFMSLLFPQFRINSGCEEADLGNVKYVRPYKDDTLVHPYVTLRTAYDGFKTGKEIEKAENYDNMKAADIPTLIMHGTDDKICDIEGTREFVKNYKKMCLKRGIKESMDFVEWPGYYHEIHNGGPDKSGDEVISHAIEFILDRRNI